MRLALTALAAVSLALAFAACSTDDGKPTTDTGTDTGTADTTGGTDTGTADTTGGTDMGATDMGATDMGATDIGATDMGATDMGATDMGATDMGATDMAGADTTPAEPNWTCVGNPQAVPPDAASIDLPLELVAFSITGAPEPLPTVDVKVCLNTDRDCASPVTTGQTDANGLVTLTLDAGTTGFVGFAEITGGGLAPTIAMVNVPIVTQRTEPVTVWLIKAAALELLATGAGVTVDATRGHLSLTSWDCAQALAGGTTFEVSTADTDTKSLYFLTTGPSDTATVTDAFGTAGFFNVPAGDLTVTIKSGADGSTLGLAPTWTKAGYVTSLIALPNQ